MNQPIIRLDDITTVPGQRSTLVDLLESDYLPAARERGLELDGVSLDGDDRVTLRCTLPDVAAFWSARRRAMTDASVARFWTDATPMVVSRERRWPQHSFDGSVAIGTHAIPESTHHIVLLADAQAPPKVRMSNGITWVGAHLPGSVSAATASLELALEPSSDVRLGDVPGAVDVVVVGERVGGGARMPTIANAIKRTLLLRVRPNTPSEEIEQFERGLLGMPHHIDAIRNWRLSRVESSRQGWTHCWEQEYETLSGLKDDYMNHPYHWAYVDGFFDPEDPRSIVDPEINHVYFEIESSILAAAAPSGA